MKVAGITAINAHGLLVLLHSNNIIKLTINVVEVPSRSCSKKLVILKVL